MEIEYVNGVPCVRVNVWLPAKDVAQYKALGGITLHLRQAVRSHSAYLNIIKERCTVEELNETVTGWV